MLLSSDRDGTKIAHPGGVQQFPCAGLPAEVPDDLGAHLLAAGGFTRHGLTEGKGTMYLSKDQGGCEIAYRGSVYAWENDGDVTEVPDELGVDLVRIGGYKVAEPPEPGAEGDDADENSADAGDSDGDDGAQEKKPARRSRGKASGASQD